MAGMMKHQSKDEIQDYYSAEFKLSELSILYQFRLRKSVTEPMFAVIKEGSKALENLKEGDVINMRYYYLDKSVPAESKRTRIKYITKDSSMGFKDHYIVGLSIQHEPARKTA